MTALRFGTGWHDTLGRARALLWLSDLQAVVFDNGHDLQTVRRGVADEVGLRARLLGWEVYVDDPDGPDWVCRQLTYWSPVTPNPDCIVCQGEGWFAGDEEGLAVPCLCGEAREPY